MKIRLRDGTGTLELKFLVEDLDRHGNVRVYVRRRGRKTRIRATPGTDEFMAEYRAALSRGPMMQPRSAAACRRTGAEAEVEARAPPSEGPS